jgi:anaerobic C4-dicarboxylate transporter
MITRVGVSICDTLINVDVIVKIISVIVVIVGDSGGLDVLVQGSGPESGACERNIS